MSPKQTSMYGFLSKNEKTVFLNKPSAPKLIKKRRKNQSVKSVNRNLQRSVIVLNRQNVLLKKFILQISQSPNIQITTTTTITSSTNTTLKQKEEQDEGYFLEVDLEYPNELQDSSSQHQEHQDSTPQHQEDQDSSQQQQAQSLQHDVCSNGDDSVVMGSVHANSVDSEFVMYTPLQQNQPIQVITAIPPFDLQENDLYELIDSCNFDCLLQNTSCDFNEAIH